MSQLRAIGAFIFGGSATFGAERAGYKVDEILELTDTMHLESAYHFVKNRPDVPVVLPNTWENYSYLSGLSNKNYDLMYANCPCSSLSQINRNASIDGKHNVHFYRLFDAINQIKPKSFIIENAPTLIKMGYPIILDMLEKLEKNYTFTIIRDLAGSHGVPMKRMRTMLVGWRRDYFDNKIPLVHMAKQDQKTVKDAIGDLYYTPLGSVPNHTLHPERNWKEFEYLFSSVKPQSSILLTVMEKWDSLKGTITDTTYSNQVEKAISKKSEGKNIWDKSPWKNHENNPAPSITSVTELIHPIHNRPWTVREYARLMGYPDDFVFYPEETSVDIIQTIAQGVPAPFIEYITSEIREAINGNRDMINVPGGLVNFQYQTRGLHKTYTYEEMKSMKSLDSDSSFLKLEK